MGTRSLFTDTSDLSLQRRSRAHSPMRRRGVPSSARAWVVPALLVAAACVAPASTALPVGLGYEHHVGAAGSKWSYSSNRPVERQLSSDEADGGSGGGALSIGRSFVRNHAAQTRGAPAALARRSSGAVGQRDAGRVDAAATNLSSTSASASDPGSAAAKALALASPLYTPGRAAAAAAAGEASVPDGRVIPAGGEQGGVGYKVWAHGIRPAPQCLACVNPVIRAGYLTTCTRPSPRDAPPPPRRGPYHSGEASAIRVDEVRVGIPTYYPAFAGKYSNFAPFASSGTLDLSEMWRTKGHGLTLSWGKVVRSRPCVLASTPPWDLTRIRSAAASLPGATPSTTANSRR